MPFGLSFHSDNKHALLTGKNRPASEPDRHIRASTGKTEAWKVAVCKQKTTGMEHRFGRQGKVN